MDGVYFLRYICLHMHIINEAISKEMEPIAPASRFILVMVRKSDSVLFW